MTDPYTLRPHPDDPVWASREPLKRAPSLWVAWCACDSRRPKCSLPIALRSQDTTGDREAYLRRMGYVHVSETGPTQGPPVAEAAL